MNGVGLATVGKLLGHRRRETTAIYAHLDDAALRDAAARAGAVIARAMGYRAEPPPLPDGTDGAGPEEPARPAPPGRADGALGAAQDGTPPKPRRFEGLVRL